MVDEPFIINKQWIDDTNGENIPHAWNPATRLWYPIPLNGGPLKDQIDAVQDTAASVEELTGSIVMGVGSTVESVEFTANRLTSVWVAPFDCRITWAALCFDYADVAASDTNYLTISLTKILSASATASLVSKTTQATGGQAIIARDPWDYAAATWASDTLLAGEVLGLEIVFTGTLSLRLPACLTFRYVPL